MARPLKDGIDYFPIDCQFNDKMKLIQAEFGLIGVGIVIRLWQRIYGEKGYYTAWDEDVVLVFASENGVGASIVSEVVSACLRRGIFDRNTYELHGVLTSEGIQERYVEATARRQRKKIDPRYLLIAIPSEKVSADNNSVNVDNNSKNVDNNTQSKVKESKVNNIHTNARTRGTHQNVVLTDDQYRAICNEIPDADAYIDRFSDRIAEKGYRYDDHYKAIMSWWAQDKGKAQGKGRKTGKKGGSFDVDDFFEAAVNRTYQDM